MDYLQHFSVPYLGIKGGNHTFYFDVDFPFFTEFDNDQIHGAKINVKLELDKRPDMAEAIFEVKGGAVLTCSRCLSDYEHILDFVQRIHIKYGDDPMDEDEVMYIAPDTSSINFAQIIYEYICLNLPMVPCHDDESDCDQEVIERLHNENENSENPSVWDSLKDIEFN